MRRFVDFLEIQRVNVQFNGEHAATNVNADNIWHGFINYGHSGADCAQALALHVAGSKEAFKELKKDPNFNTPVIALTANAIAGMKEMYLSEGFDDYLSKPIERHELERVIKKFIYKN